MARILVKRQDKIEIAKRAQKNRGGLRQLGFITKAPLLYRGVQHVQNIFQLGDHLPDQLFVLGGVVFHFMAAQLLLGTTDSVPLIIEQASDLTNGDNVSSLIVPAIAPALDRRQLGKLLLPITQDVRLYSTQVSDLSNGEVPLPRNRGEFVVMTGFQHTLLLFALVSARGEK